MADDVTNFSSSSTHRLATQSASEALQKGQSSLQPISTGLTALDAALSAESSTGIPRGEVTEIYGPPGVGKTFLAMQIAASVIKTGGQVVWIDTAHQIVPTRFYDMNSSSIRHYFAPSLAHLFALLHGDLDVGLVIIDTITTLLNLAFPKYDEKATKSDGQWSSNRRWAVISDLLARLGQLAATAKSGVIVLNETVTRFHPRSEDAVLRPAWSGKVWDSGIPTSIELYRDWLPVETVRADVRAARVLRRRGRPCWGKGVYFTIGEGLEAVASHEHETMPPPKRKHSEIADSDESVESDSDFGWDEMNGSDPVEVGDSSHI